MQGCYFTPSYLSFAQNYYRPSFAHSLSTQTYPNQNNKMVNNQSKPLYNFTFNHPPKNNELTWDQKIAAAIGGGLTLASIIAIVSELLSLRSGGRANVSKLVSLAKSRVNNNVVKRKNLSLNNVRADINNALAKGVVKNGDRVKLIKASDVDKFSSGKLNYVSNLKLKDSSMLLVDGQNKIMKIYDTAKLGDDLQMALSKNPNHLQIMC